jgi:GNAT superfamily N-acetyltransferase
VSRTSRSSEGSGPLSEPAGAHPFTVPMTSRHIEAGLRLSAQNGWNQLEADWRRQLDLEPGGCFVAEADGVVVGTACACVFETVAWVSLVLVDQAWRGRGIGTRLMERVLDYLDSRGIPSVRLDATPLGQPIYEKLGFTVEYTLTRFGGIMSRRPEAAGVERAGAADLPGIIALDTAVTNTARGRLLEHVMTRQPDAFQIVRGAEGIAAYAGCRPGARAWQIGPCLGGGAIGPSADEQACPHLLNAVGNRVAGQAVFIDIPTDNAAADNWASAAGLTPQRTLTRMGRGPRVQEHIGRLWASFGPEKG